MPVFCVACELKLANEGEPRPSGPCPKCGVEAKVWYPEGREWTFRVTRFRGESRPDAGGPWISQYTAGRSEHRISGRVHFVERGIDRVAGEYFERIIDKETGAVVREIREPLRDHRGHDSAKAKPPSLDDGAA